MSSLQERFKASLPSRPYCTDVPSDGVYRLPKQVALEKRLIQTNSDNLIRWLWFDVDKDGAWFIPEECGLPVPSMTVINRRNAHAHIGYELEAPVSLSSNSRDKPVEFLLAVQRGFTRRLGADEGYSHTLSKNPFHEAWEADWSGQRPYDLSRLNDWLDPSDKKRRKPTIVSGLGRNCSLFEELRKVAYQQVLKFKKSGQDEGQFRNFLEGVASLMNCKFQNPLMGVEVKGITKSVAKWTWQQFTEAKFSAIQSARSRRRWGTGNALSTSRPWEKDGISERTWYRRRTLNP